MPALGTLLFNLLAGLVAWLVKYFTQKVAVAVALIAIVTGLLVVIYASLRLGVSIAMASAASMHPMFAAGVGVVISPTAQQCVTAYLALWSLCELLKWKFNIIHLWSRTI